jgi:hypothetical protein
MITTIQAKLDEMCQRKIPTLDDGLAVYDMFTQVDQNMDQFRKANEKLIALWEKVKKEALSHRELAKQYGYVKKWIKAGYRRDFIKSDPQGVEFFGKRLYRYCHMFKIMKPRLTDEKIDVCFDKEKILFKVKKEWRTYSEIKDLIKYDPINKKFIGWTYVHPDGFVPFDSIEWTEAYPYAQISEQDWKELQATARRFWTSTQPEIDPGVEKPCVLQVLVISKSLQKSEYSCIQKVRDAGQFHCQLRFFNEKGQLFSAGVWTNQEGIGQIFTNHCPGFTLATANYWLSIPDVQELSEFVADSVSIPVSTARFLQMKEKLESVNKNGGLRFCMSNRNCCRFAQEMLHLAGVQVDTRTTLVDSFIDCLPKPTDIPCVRRLLSPVAQGLSSLLKAVPSPIKKFCSAVDQVASFPQKTISTLLFSLLGGTKGADINSGETYSYFDEEDTNPQQKRLINSFWDMFKGKTTVIYHSHILRTWVQKQGSYQFL